MLPTATRFPRLRAAAIAASSLLALHGGADAAVQLMVNGGFEAGNLSGWSQSGNLGFLGVECPGAAFVAAGQCDLFGGPIGSLGSISQSLAAPIGTLLNISFDFQSDGSAPGSQFRVTLGSLVLMDLINPPAAPYTHYAFVTPATTAISTLKFDLRNDQGAYFLDNVSVLIPDTAVPEPATLALVGTALAGLAASRRHAR